MQAEGLRFKLRLIGCQSPFIQQILLSASYMPETVLETWATSRKKTEDPCTLGAYTHQLTSALSSLLPPIYTNKENFTFLRLIVLPRLLILSSLSQISSEIWLKQVLPLPLPSNYIKYTSSLILKRCLFLSLFPFLFLAPHHIPQILQHSFSLTLFYVVFFPKVVCSLCTSQFLYNINHANHSWKLLP